MSLFIACSLLSCNNDVERKIQCKKEMRQMATALFPMWISGEKFDNSNIHKKIISFYKENTVGIFDPKYKRIYNDSIHDSYGHKYRINFSHTTGEVTIWSIGRNGVDENGSGDDIKYTDQVADPE